MKRTLITGVGGFIASHVLRHLLMQTDWEIVALDSFRHRGRTDRITTQTVGIDGWQQRVQVVTTDLRAPLSESLAAQIGPVDYILHLAAGSHVDRSITDPRAFTENNIGATLTMLEYARYHGTEKFFQISTDEVYGPADGDYQSREGDPHRPSNPYSASKAACEDLCFAWWRTYGMPIFITNTMNVAGEIQDASEKFIPMTIKKILAGEEVHVHASADGTRVGSRQYLHARNMADALLFILREVPAIRYGEGDLPQFNIVGDREVSNLELAQMIADIIGKPLRYRLVDFHGSRPGHDLRYAMDGSKLAALGWKAPVSFEDGLRTTVEWSVNHPEWLL